MAKGWNYEYNSCLFNHAQNTFLWKNHNMKCKFQRCSECKYDFYRKNCTKSECTYDWDTPPISSTGSVPILKTITSLLLLVNISQINPDDTENDTLNVTITYNRADYGCGCIWKNWFQSSLSTQPPPPPNNHTNPSIPLSQLAYTSTQTKPWPYILCMKLMFYNKLLWSISMHLFLIPESKIMCSSP